MTVKETRELLIRLGDLQRLLWARREEKILVVLQGIDASGKSGVINHVFKTMTPLGLRVTAFGSPTQPELGRDFLHRIHMHVPSAGEVAVFDRSHYEDVLAVRVKGLVSEERWRRRYEHINAFEAMLTDEGTRIFKFFLHVSKDEQGKRLRDRVAQEDKHWKFHSAELTTRQDWDAYREAFVEAIEKTGTDHAPWYVIPSDKKWYRNWAITSIMVQALEGMNMTWPSLPEHLRNVVID